jgi:hypothetical protein
MNFSKTLLCLSLGVSAIGVACSGSEASNGGSDGGTDASMGGNDATGNDVTPQNDTGSGGQEGGGGNCASPEDCQNPNVCCTSFGSGAGTCGPSPCTTGRQLCDGTHTCPSGETCRLPADGGTIGTCRAPHDGGSGEGGNSHDGGDGGGSDDGGDGGSDATTD